MCEIETNEKATSKSKRSHLHYRQYSSELHASMARYSDLHRLQAASSHFTQFHVLWLPTSLIFLKGYLISYERLSSLFLGDCL